MRLRPGDPPRSFIPLVVALVGIAASGALPAAAQDAGGLMSADEEMVQQLLKPRPIEELNAEYASAKRRAEEAEKDVAEADKILSVARARVDVKKEEISLLKTRAKLARREGNASEKGEIEKLLSREESVRRVFEAMRDAAKAQKDRAEAAVDFARARLEMQEAELDLARKHGERIAKTAPSGDTAPQAELASLDAGIRRSSRLVLARLRDYAKKSERLAKSTADLAESRLGLLDAWESYKGP